MGVAEPIEPLWESDAPFLRRTHRRMTKKRITAAKSARNPRTVITAIAQCGNDDDPEPDCTFPVPAEDEGNEPVTLDGPLNPPPFSLADDCDAAAAEADDSEAADADAADREDAAAADVEDIDATTESANVVWTAVKIG